MEFDKDCQMISWLDCDVSGTAGKKIVEKLKCKVCLKYKARIECKRNYSEKWLIGADSVRTSNIRDHARSDQHLYAMSLFKKESGGVSSLEEASSSSIARFLHLQGLSEEHKDQLRKKFDIAYFVAKNKLAFNKYPLLCELEARHGVDIGAAYVNENAGKTFCAYIAESRRKALREVVNSAKFYSILMDGSTDVANVDDEVFLLQWCDVDNSVEKVHSRMDFLSVSRPQSADGKGLFECLQTVFQEIGVTALHKENCKSLVGIGTDGTSANIAAAGLKGLVEAGCFGHDV